MSTKAAKPFPPGEVEDFADKQMDRTAENKAANQCSGS